MMGSMRVLSHVEHGSAADGNGGVGVRECFCEGDACISEGSDDGLLETYQKLEAVGKQEVVRNFEAGGVASMVRLDGVEKDGVEMGAKHGAAAGVGNAQQDSLVLFKPQILNMDPDLMVSQQIFLAPAPNPTATSTSSVSDTSDFSSPVKPNAASEVPKTTTADVTQDDAMDIEVEEATNAQLPCSLCKRSKGLGFFIIQHSKDAAGPETHTSHGGVGRKGRTKSRSPEKPILSAAPSRQQLQQQQQQQQNERGPVPQNSSSQHFQNLPLPPLGNNNNMKDTMPQNWNGRWRDVCIEMVCKDCEAKYRLCTECGGGELKIFFFILFFFYVLVFHKSYRERKHVNKLTVRVSIVLCFFYYRNEIPNGQIPTSPALWPGPKNLLTFPRPFRKS
jgi:hypothetical protein